MHAIVHGKVTVKRVSERANATFTAADCTEKAFVKTGDYCGRGDVGGTQDGSFQSEDIIVLWGYVSLELLFHSKEHPPQYCNYPFKEIQGTYKYFYHSPCKCTSDPPVSNHNSSTNGYLAAYSEGAP